MMLGRTSDGTISRLARDLAPSLTAVRRTWVAVRHGSVWEVGYSRMLFLAVMPLSARTVQTSSVRTFDGIDELMDPVGAIDAALADPFAIAQRELGTIFRVAGSKATFHRLYPPEHPGALRFPTLRLEQPPLSGGGATERVQLHLELLANSTPYEDLADLFIDRLAGRRRCRGSAINSR